MRTTVPVKVERYHYSARVHVVGKVVAKRGPVSIAAVAERHHNVVLLQLRQGGRVNIGIEVVNYARSLGEQVVSQSVSRGSAVSFDD